MRTPRYAISAAVALMITLLVTACGGGKPATFSTDVSELQRQAIEQAGSIGNQDYSSEMEALVKNSYRPLKFSGQADGAGGYLGDVLFAQCAQGNTFQECAVATPSPASPHVYMHASLHGKSGTADLIAGGIKRYVAVVDNTTMTCSGPSFQANPSSIKQINRVLEAFTTGGKVHTGNMDVSWPQDGLNPAQTVEWHCDAASASPAPKK